MMKMGKYTAHQANNTEPTNSNGTTESKSTNTERLKLNNTTVSLDEWWTWARTYENSNEKQQQQQMTKKHEIVFHLVCRIESNAPQLCYRAEPINKNLPRNKQQTHFGMWLSPNGQDERWSEIDTLKNFIRFISQSGKWNLHRMHEPFSFTLFQHFQCSCHREFSRVCLFLPSALAETLNWISIYLHILFSLNIRPTPLFSIFFHLLIIFDRIHIAFLCRLSAYFTILWNVQFLAPTWRKI